MKKSKHTFHCVKCDNPCSIYKKGKNHRVLVCPTCGILATNPLPLLAGLAAGKAIKTGAKLAAGLVTGNKSKDKKESDVQKIITDSKDKPNMGERIINKELYG